MIKKAMRFGAYTLSAAGVTVAGIGSAQAELPASIGTAVTAATTDVATAGGLILGVVVAIAAVAWVRRVVK